MTRYKYLLAAFLLCAVIAAGAYAAWQDYVMLPDRLTENTTVQRPAGGVWYMSSGKFASCVESLGPGQKVQEIRNTGEDPTVADDDHGTVQVMREGPPEQWVFFKSKALCDAYNDAGRKGAP